MTIFVPNASTACGSPSRKVSARPTQCHPRAKRSGTPVFSMVRTSLMRCLLVGGRGSAEVPPVAPVGVSGDLLRGVRLLVHEQALAPDLQVPSPGRADVERDHLVVGVTPQR